MAGMAAKVLVVEDDEDLRDSLATLLQDEYEVVTACNGDEGIAIARQQRPAVILLDILMPMKDGFETIACLREDRSTRNIPIVMLTAASGLQQRVKAFNLGADDFIPKPFEPEELLARLQAKIRSASQV